MKTIRLNTHKNNDNFPPYFSGIVYVNERKGKRGTFLSLRISLNSIRFYDENGEEAKDYEVATCRSLIRELAEWPADQKDKPISYADFRIAHAPNKADPLPEALKKEGSYVVMGESKGFNFSHYDGENGRRNLVFYLNWESLGDEIHPLPALPKKNG